MTAPMSSASTGSSRRCGAPASAPGANVYAELGTTWRSVMGDTTQAAHLLGKLLLHVGEDNVLWGTDSIWYGSPQDQIQAFRAFEIRPSSRSASATGAHAERKAKILGLNAARIYGVEPTTVPCPFTREDLQAARQALPQPFRTYGPRTAAEVAAVDCRKGANRPLPAAIGPHLLPAAAHTAMSHQAPEPLREWS